MIPNADHYAFLPPCSPELAAAAPQLCTDPPGFDRAAFHRSFDAEVVRFFSQTLR
jgi:predicted dienelactone hydrolase